MGCCISTDHAGMSSLRSCLVILPIVVVLWGLVYASLSLPFDPLYRDDSMARSVMGRVATAAVAAGFFGAQQAFAQSATTASSQTSSIGTVTIDGAASTYSVQYTPPASIDAGEPILPNVLDPQAVDVQTVCPGYTASQVQHSATGFSASLTLAGQAVS